MGNHIIYQDFSGEAHAQAADCAYWDVPAGLHATADGIADAPAKPAQLGNAAAIVLAYDEATTPARVTFDDPKHKPATCAEDGTTPRPLQEYEGHALVAWAVRCALAAGITHVTVVVGESEAAARAMSRALDAVNCGNADDENPLWHATYTACTITLAPYDSEAAELARKASRNFELYGVSEYLLEVARDTCNAERTFILACDQPRIEPRHLAALAARMDDMPGCEVVTSWIAWLRRTPLLVSATFLAGLEARKLARAAVPAPACPVEQMEVSEVVFGEEMLATNATQPAPFANFFSQVSMSALKAVRTAKQLRKLNEDERAALLEPLNEADLMLVHSAEATLASLDCAAEEATPCAAPACGTQETFAAQLAWADAWGQRNRGDFPIFAKRAHRDTLVYLDSAATTQRLDRAVEAERTFDLEENANVYRGGYDLSMQATFALNDARAALEAFIGAKRRETIYTQNTTGGANLVAQAWGDANIQAGDLIVTSIAEHHSNMLPWMLLAERRGARLAFLPLDNQGAYDQHAYRTLLAQKPRLVALALCGNVLGLNAPAKEMIAAAHEAGAVVFVDGAQGLAHQRVQVRELGCDFFAFSGHKIYGPLGIGGVWINPDRLAEMRPVALGGGAVSHVGCGSYYLRLGAIAYENGTPAISAAIGLAQAVEYLGELGMDAVSTHARLLTRYLMMGLRSIEGVTVWGNHECEAGESGLVSLNVAGLLPSPLGVYLGKLGIATRSGGHCALPLAASLGVVGTTRISIGVYNTVEDIQAALTGLRVLSQLALHK